MISVLRLVLWPIICSVQESVTCTFLKTIYSLHSVSSQALGGLLYLSTVSFSPDSDECLAPFLQVASRQNRTDKHNNLLIISALFPLEPGVLVQHRDAGLPRWGGYGARTSNNSTKVSYHF